MGTYDNLGGYPLSDSVFDDPCVCIICNRYAEDCICPECPWCGSHGDITCSVNGGNGCKHEKEGKKATWMGIAR